MRYINHEILVKVIQYHSLVHVYIQMSNILLGQTHLQNLLVN